ncbi:MAG: dTDP-4-dehydrorhamnose 3,5-epimerase [Burkholderiales bacterium]|nr:dTDP-4-dehydrorhamnose 3,5-epimerase [Burkholderiales bacterium]
MSAPMLAVEATPLPGCLILTPRVFRDERGHFFESFNARRFREATGLDVAFVQDNESVSTERVLRGIHYQIEQAQGKLVRVAAGAVWDVAVDLRRSSPTFGRWFGVELSAENGRQFWIPPGFGHAFVVTRGPATFLYKTTDYYAPEHERTIRWDDPTLAIAWPVTEPILSTKDAAGALFRDAEVYP